jgi:class 3 adenylate cyclase
MTVVAHSKEQDCDAEPLALWRVVTDTERMARAMGFDRVQVKPLSDAGSARHLVTTKIAGLVVEYEERPFEWVEPERFTSRRVCRRGPLKLIATTWTLAPRPGGGTHVKVVVELEPASSLLLPLARVAASKSAISHMREVELADQRLRAGQPPFSLAPLHAAAGPALDRAVAALRHHAGAELGLVVDRLVDLVRSGADPDVGRIRPFELAERWSIGRRELVTVCLLGVSAGLLELSWDLVCPSCRTASERLAELSAVGEAGHCHLCELSFGVDLDRAVEATFRPAAAVRVIDDAPLCISGPARTPHVLCQKLLPARGTLSMLAPVAPGRYRLFVRGGAVATLDVDEGEGAAPVGHLTVADTRIEPASLAVRPGATLELSCAAPNQAGERHVKLERAAWASQAATAYFVSTLPAFRRQFSGQVLRPGLSLKVARATVLFSDLTASTALYAREGDATAFKLVQDHFDVLFGEIERHRGAVVKTIGDAVMAVFDDEEDGVRGAVAMLRAFEAFRQREPLVRRGEVYLKLGLFAGPCFVVTANKILDYFGQSVNVAARLQAKAEAGEVVVPAALADAAEAGGWLVGAAVQERIVTAIKGLDEPIRAARIAAFPP